jgi:hypothetical protein
MSTPAYNTTIEITGTSTAMTGEAMTGSGAGPYQVTSAKRVFDPAVAFTFYDNGTAINASDILTVDYLFGKVTFTSSKTGPITVTGSYLPRLTFLEGRSVGISLDADELDTSVFGSGWKNSTQGLMQLTVDVETLALLTADMDPGAGSRKLSSIFTGRTSVVLSVTPGGTGSAYRAFVITPSEKEDAAVADLLKATATFKSTAPRAVDGTIVTPTIG